jgi:hypothetical protein
MKKIVIFLFLFSLSQNVFSDTNCDEQATKIAWQAMELFDVGDEDIHCEAAGLLKNVESKEKKYSEKFKLDFFFLCGPKPQTPTIKIVLNKECKIVKLRLKGFEKINSKN